MSTIPLLLSLTLCKPVPLKIKKYEFPCLYQKLGIYSDIIIYLLTYAGITPRHEASLSRHEHHKVH